MRTYKCLKNQVFEDGEFKIEPIRDEDMFSIMKWRNEQIYHLRQSKPLTIEDQEFYFSNVVSQLFDQDKPKQILFSLLQHNELIGYGGLVHINWIDKNAEISFLMNTELEKYFFEQNWIQFLHLIEKVAFLDLKLHKIFTFAFDLRPNLYVALETAGFNLDARLREHCLFDNKFIDVLIHSKYNNRIFFRKANYTDSNLFFEWTNDDLTRFYSFNSKLIELDTHQKWFTEKLKDKNCFILVFENHLGIPIGQVRVETKNEENVIGISIDKKFRGNSYAHQMILKACNIYFNEYKENSIIAYIKQINVASYKSFEKAGFVFSENVLINNEQTVKLRYLRK